MRSDHIARAGLSDAFDEPTIRHWRRRCRPWGSFGVDLLEGALCIVEGAGALRRIMGLSASKTGERPMSGKTASCRGGGTAELTKYGRWRKPEQMDRFGSRAVQRRDRSADVAGTAGGDAACADQADGPAASGAGGQELRRLAMTGADHDLREDPPPSSGAPRRCSMSANRQPIRCSTIARAARQNMPCRVALSRSAGLAIEVIDDDLVARRRAVSSAPASSAWWRRCASARSARYALGKSRALPVTAGTGSS